MGRGGGGKGLFQYARLGVPVSLSYNAVAAQTSPLPCFLLEFEGGEKMHATSWEPIQTQELDRWRSQGQFGYRTGYIEGQP